MPWRRTMSRARNSAARPEVRRRSTTGRVRRNKVIAARLSPMASRPGPKSGRPGRGRGTVWIPTSRSETAHIAVHHGMWVCWWWPMWQELDGDGGEQGDADDAEPEGHHRRPERGPVGGGLEVAPVGDQQERSTAKATNDSSKSAPATRCKTMVRTRAPPPPATPVVAREDPPSQGHECQSGDGENGAGRLAGPEREELEHHVQPAAQWRGERVEQVDDPRHQDGRRGPATYPPGPAVGLVEVGGRWPRLAHRVGSHQRRVQAPDTASPGHHPLERARRAEIVAVNSIRTCNSAPVSSSTQLTRWLWVKTGGRPSLPRCSSTTSAVAPTLA